MDDARRPIDSIGRPLAAGLAAALLLHAGTGCAPEAELWAKQRFLASMLEAEAAHLDPPTRDRIAASLCRAEAEHRVDALLLFAVAERESRFRLTARGPRGALGLMQVRPSTARAVAEQHAIAFAERSDLHDPETNIAIGAAYLAELVGRFGSLERALTAYNRGPSRTPRASPATPSRYAGRILRRYELLLERFEAGRAGAR